MQPKKSSNYGRTTRNEQHFQPILAGTREGQHRDLNFPRFTTKFYEGLQKIGFFTNVIFCCITFQSKCMVIKPRNACKIGIKAGRDKRYKKITSHAELQGSGSMH